MDLVGFGRIWSDSVRFGRIFIFSKFGQFGWTLSDLVGFGRIWSDPVVGSGVRIRWSDSVVGFGGRIRSDLVGFGRSSPWEGT